MDRLIQFAKELRNNPIEQERFLWNHIKSKQLSGVKFRRQKIIEGYIVDFYSAEKKLVIELDGSQHADSYSDVKRDKLLKLKGYRVLRIWNLEINKNMEGVLEFIKANLESRVDTYRYRRKKI